MLAMTAAWPSGTRCAHHTAERRVSSGSTWKTHASSASITPKLSAAPAARRRGPRSRAPGERAHQLDRGARGRAALERDPRELHVAEQRAVRRGRARAHVGAEDRGARALGEHHTLLVREAARRLPVRERRAIRRRDVAEHRRRREAARVDGALRVFSDRAARGADESRHGLLVPADGTGRAQATEVALQEWHAHQPKSTPPGVSNECATSGGDASDFAAMSTVQGISRPSRRDLDPAGVSSIGVSSCGLPGLSGATSHAGGRTESACWPGRGGATRPPGSGSGAARLERARDARRHTRTGA